MTAPSPIVESETETSLATEEEDSSQEEEETICASKATPKKPAASKAAKQEIPKDETVLEQEVRQANVFFAFS